MIQLCNGRNEAAFNPIENAMKHTLGEAAKVVGFSKSTISRAIKTGALSAKRLDDGSFSIEPSELERWNTSNSHSNAKMKKLSTPVATAETSNETGVLEAELKGARELLARADAERERLEADRDKWREQAERVTLLLEDNRPRSGGFLGRLLGRK